MRRRRLFDDPQAWKERRDLLLEQECPNPQRLMEVEATLTAMQMLGLDDEIVGGGAYLLTGALLYPYSTLWTDEQRRVVANARQLSPFRSRWAWRDALLEYAGLDAKWRLYALLDKESDVPGRDCQTDSEPWENITLDVAFCPKRAEAPPCRENLSLYRQCLSEPLPYTSNPGMSADADKVYTFQVKPHGDPVDLSVRFPQDEMPAPFTPAPVVSPTREPLYINIKRDLCPVAKDLDEREALLAARFGWQPHERGNWQGRLAKIHLREVENGAVADNDEQILRLEGFHHAAGMVASGKSTLSLLLAAYLVQRNRDKRDAEPLRLTLVVGDTQSSLRLANQVNWWFCDDPETDTPVAVALLGRSGRERHGHALQASRDYQEGNRRGQAHFGERWLNHVCPLQGFIPPDQITLRLKGETLPLGQEPCQHLQDTDSPKDPKRLCPLFGICPSQQTFHDLPHATVWITTPQAMALGSVPRHIEPRPIHLGEMIYENSDIVIFDEADAVMAHFDDTYAVEVALMSGGDGVYDRVSVDMERDLVRYRVRDTGQQKWSAAERDGIKASEGLLTLLRTEQEHPYLSQWVRQGFFTPGAILHRLVRRITGVPESPFPETPSDTLKAWSDAAKKVRAVFDPLLTIPSDPLRPTHRDTFGSATAQLYQILQDINREGPASGRSRSIHLDCRRWLRQTWEDLEETLKNGVVLAAEQQEMRRTRMGKKTKKGEPPAPHTWPYTVDDLTTLAYRLQFTLSVFLVDLHGRYLFEAWDDKVAPGEVDVSPFHRIPAVMQDILPLPPVGAQFGMYFSARDDEGRPRDHLARFCYTNIGRWYFLNFHRLLTDLTGERGPHVLALSGTSYLPDSVRFHVGWQGTRSTVPTRSPSAPPPIVVPDPAFPRSILIPENTASEAIAKSEFIYAPVLHPNRTPLRLSGVEQRLRPEAFHHLAGSLSVHGDTGLLGRELALLGERAILEKTLWQDRARLLLLVNSYKQAAWVAAGLRVGWPDHREQIYHLRQQETQAQDVLWNKNDALNL